MDKKRELLAKALMDASKVLLITVYVASFLGPGLNSFLIAIGHIVAIMTTGYLAWFIQPQTKEK